MEVLVLLLLMGMICLFCTSHICRESVCVYRAHVGICSVAVLQECVERSCVAACWSYFRLSGDAAAGFFFLFFFFLVRVFFFFFLMQCFSVPSEGQVGCR